jgi:hypothetical protein
MPRHFATRVITDTVALLTLTADIISAAREQTFTARLATLPQFRKVPDPTSYQVFVHEQSAAA